MKIGLVNNNTTVQSKIGQETATESTRKVDTQESKKNIAKSKTDSTEISSDHNTSFEDSRLNVAKSSVLYDVTVKESDRLSELKEAVQNGTYNVSADLLAEAILK